MKMKKRKIGFASAIFGLLGAFFAAVCLYLALTNIDSSPVLLEQPRAALTQVNTMLDALCAGEYDTVSGCLYGQPDLGIDREPEDEVGKLFWDALADSFSYELKGNFYATDSGVALNVTIRALDLSSVTAGLREEAQALMQQRIDQAEDTDDIYDENYEFREEFVMDALHQATENVLAREPQYRDWDLVVNLIYENGRWWIMPEPDLLNALSGGILG